MRVALDGLAGQRVIPDLRNIEGADEKGNEQIS